jgi:putative acetyltransferase
MNTPLKQVMPLRHAAREMVRELGILQSAYVPASLPLSHCHALVEIETRPLAQNQLGDRLRLDKSTTSRIVAGLVRAGLVRAKRDSGDQRRTRLELTVRGKSKLQKVHRDANAQVQSALELLTPEQRETVLTGLSLYATALERARTRASCRIHPIRRADNAGVEKVIRTVLPEFMGTEPGFSTNDAEIADMYSSYSRPRSVYFVIERSAKILGGGGIAPLDGGDPDTCELCKMYLLSEIRGLGLGQSILDRCLEAARDFGYRRCYLETLRSMHQARALYEKNRFRPLKKPTGWTGHFRCDSWYAINL